MNLVIDASGSLAREPRDAAKRHIKAQDTSEIVDIEQHCSCKVTRQATSTKAGNDVQTHSSSAHESNMPEITAVAMMRR